MKGSGRLLFLLIKMKFQSTIGETEWLEAGKKAQLNFERTGRARQNSSEQMMYNYMAKMYDG